MALPGIFINKWGAKDEKIVTADRAGGAKRARKKSLLLMYGDEITRFPAAEAKKRQRDKRILRTPKFRNKSPKWCRFSIDPLNCPAKLTYHRPVTLANSSEDVMLW